MYGANIQDLAGFVAMFHISYNQCEPTNVEPPELSSGIAQPGTNFDEIMSKISHRCLFPWLSCSKASFGDSLGSLDPPCCSSQYPSWCELLGASS
jgi:hypothetical protein